MLMWFHVGEVEKEGRGRCQMSAGWHSSKLENSRHGRLIVLARGCTTILSLGLLLFSVSSFPRFPKSSVTTNAPVLFSPSAVWEDCYTLDFIFANVQPAYPPFHVDRRIQFSSLYLFSLLSYLSIFNWDFFHFAHNKRRQSALMAL